MRQPGQERGSRRVFNTPHTHTPASAEGAPLSPGPARTAGLQTQAWRDRGSGGRGAQTLASSHPPTFLVNSASLSDDPLLLTGSAPWAGGFPRIPGVSEHHDHGTSAPTPEFQFGAGLGWAERSAPAKDQAGQGPAVGGVGEGIPVPPRLPPSARPLHPHSGHVIGVQHQKGRSGHARESGR